MFRRELYRCLTRRADAVFDVVDAVLCTDGPVRSLPELSLVGERAAFGAARRLDRRDTVRLVTLGFVIAIGAHFGTNASMPYLNSLVMRWFDPDPRSTRYCSSRSSWFCSRAPSSRCMYSQMHRSARDEVRVLANALDTEARTGTGDVTPAE